MDRFIQGNTYYHFAHPSCEFDRNFKIMKGLGINAVRVAEIWPGWSVIEHKPGQYDYEELDRYVEQAWRNGLKVCMGVGINDTPFWLFAKYPDLRMREYDGTKSTRRVQSACFDHVEYRRHMNAFIESITKRYADNEAVFCWQIGNEIRYNVQYCDCPATRIRFREWLKQRYNNDLDSLNKEWGVFYNGWEEIYPYKSYDGPPTEGISAHCIATQKFQGWSLEELIGSSVAIMKKYTDKPIFHNNNGTPNMKGTHWNLVKPCDIAVIDIYASTYEKPGFYQGLLLDTMKSIAKQQNKPLWIGETPAGQYGTFKRIKVDKRLVENCVMDQLGAGAKAIFHFRHKAPVFEQPHKYTGSQTFLRIDESEMEYAQIPKSLAQLMDRFEDRILGANPPEAKIGMYYPGESILFGKEAGYIKEQTQSVFGTRSIVAGAQLPVEIMDTDSICAMDLTQFKIIVVPVSYLLPSSVGNVLKSFVENGGVLICEARPGYVNENGWLYERQPGAGLDEVFGAREDLFYYSDNYGVEINIKGKKYEGFFTGIKQTYRLTEGTAIARDNEGNICGVYNRFGKGEAYLFGGAIGLHFGVGAGKYDTSGGTSDNPAAAAQRKIYCRLYEDLASLYGVVRPVGFTGGNPELSTRYLENEKEILMFMVNFNKNEDVEVDFDKEYNNITHLTVNGELPVEGNRITIPSLEWRIVSVKK